MYDIAEWLNRIVWGVPALIGILGVGLFLTIGSGFIQFRELPASLRLLFSDSSENRSSKRAMWTALAATVGTGNIVGVGGAIALGGPGALFWMWVSGMVGMMTKFAEAALAIRYRVKNEAGEFVGGPMYMIREGLGKHWHGLAVSYSILGLIASFGVGNAVQVNAIVSSLEQTMEFLRGSFDWHIALATGVIVSFLLALVCFAGANWIGRVSEMLVPWASGIYLLLCICALCARWNRIPEALISVVTGAFYPKAVTGGAIGAMFLAMRTGISRGVFTNEAGMGTAAIAHAAGQSDPIEQGRMGILEVFLDTIVICTMTGMVILTSGIPISYGSDFGSTLTLRAFCNVCGNGVSILLSICMSCFAFATLLGWGLYGGRCAQFLFGSGAWKWFCWCQILISLVGCVSEAKLIWLWSELFNGLMSVPNLLVLTALSPELFRLLRCYKNESVVADVGGTYENFNQRQSMRTFSHAKIPSAGESSGETW